VRVNDFYLYWIWGFSFSSIFYLIFIGDFFITIGEVGALIIGYGFFLIGVDGIDFLQGLGEA
jgi:hypothetical protein